MNVYLIHTLCRRILHDAAFRQRVRADPEAALATMPFTGAEREALLAGDVARLYGEGAHPFLLLILSRFGCLGLDLPTFNRRIRVGIRDRDRGTERRT